MRFFSYSVIIHHPCVNTRNGQKSKIELNMGIISIVTSSRNGIVN